MESPSIEFGEDSDSRLVEHMLASVAQHQREKNAEQTVNRMKARLMNGYYVFQPPVGFRYRRDRTHGNMLFRDEPVASIIQEALEGFAMGRFQTKAEVQRFLENQPDFPKGNTKGYVHPQRVDDLLRHHAYAGLVEAPKWKVARRNGHHEGLISIEMFQRIQDRLDNREIKAAMRTDINADFPLRGFVLCAKSR